MTEEILSFSERQKQLNEEAKERYDLARERIGSIHTEKQPDGALGDYFLEVSMFLMTCMEIADGVAEGTIGKRTLTECEHLNDRLYQPQRANTYGESFLNPDVATGKLGDENGRLLCFLYSELYAVAAYAFEGRIYQMTLFLELFLLVYSAYQDEWPYDEIKEDIYWFYHDNSEIFTEDMVYESLDTSYDFFTKIVMEADLTTPTYLYAYGTYIGPNERMMSAFLAGLPGDEIKGMADTLFNGFVNGFTAMRKDISKKKSVKLEFPMGMELVAREVAKDFEGIGIKAIMTREPFFSFTGIGGRKRGVYGTSVNQQFEFDHKNDKGFWLDKKTAKRILEVREATYEKLADLALDFAGPALTEVYGREDFEPVSKTSAISLDEEQKKVRLYQQNKTLELTNRFMPEEGRSFSIISYPVPSIGANFEDIFRMTMRVNTLDYKLYQQVQQKIIDVLDRGVRVHVKGSGENRTDITVSLHELAADQTNFENCVADVNIPVGEVFTSPVLAGTSGILNVSEVFLEGLCFKNLCITFEDGMVKDYTCDNFPKEADNRKLIEENILFFHKSLPIGEFAIGTNTTAFVEAKRYDILPKLPILIAEKCGPHFAVGDTCYSYEEDSHLFNPDGKEIIAKENEVSALRKEDPEKAYFSCHTDITIPYQELEYIKVETKEGEMIPVIENGRFTIPGTEELNRPLDEFFS